MLLSGVATEVEVTSWLGDKEDGFIRKLTEIGVRRGLGFHKEVNGQIERDVVDGEYTGDGLCFLATGVIEAGVQRRFGKEVETRGAILGPVRKDTGKEAPFSHTVLRIVAEDGQVTVDATLRQLDFGVRNRIHVFPTEEEGKIYGGREIATLSPGACVSDARHSVGRGMIRNVSIKDFEELIDTLK